MIVGTWYRSYIHAWWILVQYWSDRLPKLLLKIKSLVIVQNCPFLIMIEIARNAWKHTSLYTLSCIHHFRLIFYHLTLENSSCGNDWSSSMFLFFSPVRNVQIHMQCLRCKIIFFKFHQYVEVFTSFFEDIVYMSFQLRRLFFMVLLFLTIHFTLYRVL